MILNKLTASVLIVGVIFSLSCNSKKGVIGCYKNPSRKSALRKIDWYIHHITYPSNQMLCINEDSTYIFNNPCSGIDTGKWKLVNDSLVCHVLTRVYFNDSLQKLFLAGNIHAPSDYVLYFKKDLLFFKSSRTDRKVFHWVLFLQNKFIKE